LSITIGLTDELVNTHYAPLAVLGVYYQQHQSLQPLKLVSAEAKKRDFSLFDKLLQTLMSILAGCNTLSEVNSKLSAENSLAKAARWDKSKAIRSIAHGNDRDLVGAQSSAVS
jgi:hypothetical protein